MNRKTLKIAMFLMVGFLIPLFLLGCGGGGEGGSGHDPMPTVSPFVDFYNIVKIQSDQSIFCGVASTNVIDGDYQVAPPNDRNHLMTEFPFNARILEYFYSPRIVQASGISNHAFFYPQQIRRHKTFSAFEAPEDPRGLFTFVNNNSFNTIENRFEYPREIRIETPSEGESIQAGRSFQVKWDSDEDDYHYFIIAEYAEVSADGLISRAWSSDDFRSLNWADPASIYLFMLNKTTRDKEIYIPAALFTSTGALNITVYGFIPEKFQWTADSQAGGEILAVGKKTIRVNLTP